MKKFVFQVILRIRERFVRYMEKKAKRPYQLHGKYLPSVSVNPFAVVYPTVADVKVD